MNQTGREAAREPHAMTSRTANGESVETALQLAIDLHGPALLNRPEKLARQLEAQCPQAATDIAFLLAALEERVPQALLAVKAAADLQAVEPQLVQGLCERRGLNPFAATWTVSTWAAALRMDLFGTAGTRTPIAPNGAAPAYRPGPRGGSTPPEPLAALDESPTLFGTKTTAGLEPRTVPFMPFTLPFGAQAEPKAMPAVPLPQAGEPWPQAVAEVVAPIEVGTGCLPDVPPPIGEPVPPAPTLHAPALDAEPTAIERPAELADDAALEVAGPVAAAGEALPDWMTEDEPEVLQGGPRRFNPWWGIAGVIVALLVAVGSIGIMSSMNSPPTPAAATSPVVAAAVRPAPAIVDVVSDATLIGDGAEHDVFVAVDPSRDDVRSVEATFMGGAGPWEKDTRVIAVSPEALRDGRIAVGRIGLRTAAPATATFQYVLTTADGARSTPFVKQFAFTPVAPRPPAIVDVIAPPGLVAGTPFTLTIDFTPGESAIASVERKPVGAHDNPDATSRVTSIAALASPKDGTLRYPFEAIASASRTTYAFTLVDRDGGRSETKEVVIDVAAAKRSAASATAAPARGEPAACTRATCGSVVSVSEIDRSKNYEVLMRMDDRSIQTMVAKNPPKVGARIRRGDGRPAPLDVAKGARTKPSTRAPAKLLPESPPIVDR